ncbi:MAG TPA: hypothetical protein DD429_07765 [Clostridiaceae bacterium]|jgi:capsular polysaccharide biosynthesis protein|nr:hypothetical protein [Clostridiaceae bacterium]
MPGMGNEPELCLWKGNGKSIMDIRDFLKYFWERKWIVIALAALCIILSEVFTLINKPVYRQTRVILVGPQTVVSKDGKFVTNLSFVIADLAKNDDVDEKIAKAVGNNLDKNAISNMLSAKADDQHQKVEITVEGSDRKLVSDIASNAFPVIKDISKEMFKVENLVVITEDKEPYPVNKDYKKSLISGGVTGFGLGLIAVFLMLLFDDRIKGKNEIKNLFGMDYLGTAKGEESIAELSARVLLRLKGNSQKILADINLSKSGDSKSVYDIATYLARLGKKVLVIDLNKSSLGIPVNEKSKLEFGLSDLLYGKKTDVKETVCNSDIENLDVMAFGTQKDIGRTPLADGSMMRIINDVRDNYDILILNIPQYMSFDRVLLILNHCDCAVMSVEKDRVSLSDVTRMTDEFKDTGVGMLGYYTL